MKKIFLTTAALGLLTVSLIGVAEVKTTAPASATNPDTSSIYHENRRNISVTADNPEFTIHLKSNPTTGYSWFIKNINTNLITPVKHSFQKPDSAMLGAAGEAVWVFKVKPDAFKVPQQTTIELIYARPWEGDDKAYRVEFTVSIQ